MPVPIIILFEYLDALRRNSAEQATFTVRRGLEQARAGSRPAQKDWGATSAPKPGPPGAAQARPRSPGAASGSATLQVRRAGQGARTLSLEHVATRLP